METISKNDGKSFVKKVHKFLVKDLGAKKVSSKNDIIRYQMETKVGKIDISIEQKQWLSKLFSIYAKFQDPDLAVTKFNSNAISGKYNFMEFIKTDVDNVIELAFKHFAELK